MPVLLADVFVSSLKALTKHRTVGAIAGGRGEENRKAPQRAVKGLSIEVGHGSYSFWSVTKHSGTVTQRGSK